MGISDRAKSESEGFCEVSRGAQSGKIKGGIRCLDAGPLHGTPKSTPDASRTVPPEGFPTHAAPNPRALRRERCSSSEDPSLQTPIQILRSFATNAAPGPKALRRERCSGSEDPSLRTLLRVRGPFVAQEGPSFLNALRATKKFTQSQSFCG